VEPQGLDRNALIGILLMSLLLGVWMVYTAPSQEQAARQQATADSVAAVEEARARPSADAEIGPDTPDALATPTDSAFATTGADRLVTVRTDRYEATFSTRGGTLVRFRLLGFNHATTTEPVELVSDQAGALAIGFVPPQGAYLDSRSLAFSPLVGTTPFAGDSLRATDAPAELRFETRMPGQNGRPGALRFVYSFEPDSYDIGMRVEAVGTDVLARGTYDLTWSGALPLAEENPKGETAQAGAYLRSGGETESIHLTEPTEAEPITRTGAVDWIAVKTKFFIAAVIPTAPTVASGAKLTGQQVGTAGEEGFGQDYTASLEMPALTAGQAQAVTLYLGPLELRRLAAYGLYDTVDFGFGGWITRPIARYVIAPTFALLSTFISSYGLVIILFALIVKLVLWPLTSASYRSAAKMRELQPELAALKETHPDDPAKQQEAMMRLYKERGVNPLGGCLPMLLQYPILIALWRFFQSTLVLRGEPFLWAPDLSAPDVILNLPFSIPAYGNYVSGFTLLMAGSMIISMKLSQPSGNAVTGQQKAILYMMPLIFLLFFNGFPAGLSLYYLAFNIFSVVQQRMVNKQVHEQAEKGEIPGVGAAAPKVMGKPKTNGRTNGRLTSDAVASATRRRKK
jgi:YidC/Oxa1 family membrane protein insertase